MSFIFGGEISLSPPEGGSIFAQLAIKRNKRKFIKNFMYANKQIKYLKIISAKFTNIITVLEKKSRKNLVILLLYSNIKPAQGGIKYDL
tara:strand:- start:1445 stop:1711 length:267 start_codon:yes stop_codon:yes gene_type:complete